MQTDEEILAAFRDTAETATRHIKEAEDPKSPVHRELPERRRLATGAFNQARQTAILAAGDLRSARMGEALREFADDPVDHAARTADLLEADQMARGMGKVEATNKLLPAGWEALGLGQLRQAEVYMRAARLAGALDTALSKAITEAKCEIFPNRISALAKGSNAHNSYDITRLEVEKATANFHHLVHNGPDAAQAMLAVKMADWVAAQAEKRPIKSASDLGLPDTSRPAPDYTNLQMDSRLHGVEERRG
jgi:hypothetical protein